MNLFRETTYVKPILDGEESVVECSSIEASHHGCDTSKENPGQDSKRTYMRNMHEQTIK